MAHAADETCPHLVYALIDRLWLYPTRGYCHRPGGRVFVPAGATLDRICTTAAYRECPGYRATSDPRRDDR